MSCRAQGRKSGIERVGNPEMPQQGRLATARTQPGANLESTRGVRLWLLAVTAMIFAMVLVGGATRLTESGLSITQWQPVTGVVLPLGEAQWAAEFARYKQIPQYSQLNPDMDLAGFKAIYYWE